jgi:hypothetical protein
MGTSTDDQFLGTAAALVTFIEEDLFCESQYQDWSLLLLTSAEHLFCERQ